jgi:hypothetical protein
MFRPPYYLEIPSNLRWETLPHRHHHHLWWLIAALTLMAIFLIGVGATSGTLQSASA